MFSTVRDVYLPSAISDELISRYQYNGAGTSGQVRSGALESREGGVRLELSSQAYCVLADCQDNDNPVEAAPDTAGFSGEGEFHSSENSADQRRSLWRDVEEGEIIDVSAFAVSSEVPGVGAKSGSNPISQMVAQCYVPPSVVAPGSLIRLMV